MSTVLIINGLGLVALLISLLKDVSKTKRSLLIAVKSLLKIVPSILAIILLIGLIYGLFADKIELLFGEQSGLSGFFLIAIMGAILHLPSLLAFPLASSFLAEGASYSAVAAFITTLTMIGIVTLPLEIETMGKKFALWRNLLSFVMALIIALIMGVIL
ncbi:MAG: hypothetical protein R6U84_02405 [Candidatus Cloacimonadales bacterium]